MYHKNVKRFKNTGIPYEAEFQFQHTRQKMGCLSLTARSIKGVLLTPKDASVSWRK